jgi:hypothetical protein
MTNDVREKAIETACQAYKNAWNASDDYELPVWISAAIDAYEKAMWRPISKYDPGMGSVFVEYVVPGIGGWIDSAVVTGTAILVGDKWMSGGVQIETPIRFCPKPLPPTSGDPQ